MSGADLNAEHARPAGTGVGEAIAHGTAGRRYPIGRGQPDIQVGRSFNLINASGNGGPLELDDAIGRANRRQKDQFR